MMIGLLKKIYLLAVCAGLMTVSCKKDKDQAASHSRYISKVYAYVPAPGQYINDSTWGAFQSPATVIGGVNGTVSLGAYGGYIVFGFDHAVQNGDGADMAIYGNPLQPPYEWSEPGIVMVSRDVNGNGLPDDEWYELAGSEYTSDSTIKNYTITYYNPKKRGNVLWRDSRGKSDSVLVNVFHAQTNYYPLFIAGQDSVSFTGSLLRNTFTTSSGGLYTNISFTKGYTDSWSSGDNYTTNKYNSFDISQAVNSSGASVSLSQIHFVKVYTGQNCIGNVVMGEISTEMMGAADLHTP